MTKGHVILIPFPFTDLTGQKNRPALVLAQSTLDVTVAFITSQINWSEEFDFRIEPSNTNGLKSTSLIRVNKLATIEKSLVLGKLGELSKEQLHNVDNLLRAFLKLA